MVALAGMFWAPLRPIYDWSWFVGFGLAGSLYWLTMRGTPLVPPAGVPEARIAPPR
jgi:cytosine/uracil/thiamine/allantoin permease